ncbi:MFS transporter, DHA2 family, multidrug resistance protein [Streptomyces wuyuanensis]|uniref:MFS transporter, DHA2 family, multidrug resistance protein n=2 Tax=Streptomyces wuyuanensis TaxID=1196353 RepID=A0A1G9MP50_9ACTN|nr:MFS transporter, DHA2 family, multidrug resistance protein [Streptomyces wuyuanensis]
MSGGGHAEHMGKHALLSERRKWATLATACLTMLLLSVDLTVLHLAVPRLTAELRPTSTQLLWIADVYGFALGGLLITMGNVGDRVGRRRLLLVGTFGFGAASGLTAYAWNAELLIVARALLGVAGSTLMPSTLSIIRNTFTDPVERTRAIGIWSSVSSAGFAVGPLIGGLLLDHFWWGSVFLINIPVMLLIFVVGFFVLPESKNPRPGRLDALSVLLSVTGIAAVIYTIKDAAHDGFAQTDVAVACVVGVGALTLFAWRQGRLETPLIDVALFRNRGFSASVGATVMAMFALAGVGFVGSQYFQVVLGWSPLRSAVAQLPGVAGAVAGAVLAPKLAAAAGRARTVGLGLTLVSVGLLQYLWLSTEVYYPAVLAALIVTSSGVAMTFTVTADSVLESVPRERAGAASAISETAYEMGGALGIAVLGSVLSRVYRDGLDMPPGIPGEHGAVVRESLAGAMDVAGRLTADLGAALATTAREAFIDGFHATVAACSALAAIVMVATWIALRGAPAPGPAESAGEEAAPATPPARSSGDPDTLVLVADSAQRAATGP